MNTLQRCALASLICLTPSAAAVLLDQPLVFINGRASTSVNDTTGFRTWDRITLNESALVNRITWIGAFIDTVDTANNPVNPAGDLWNLHLAGDNAGDPGAVQQQASFSLASVTPTYLGTGSLAGQPVYYYQFAVDLSTPFAFAANQTLWLAIFSSAPQMDPRFGWSSGSGGDGVSKMVQLNNNDITSWGDRALSLEGEVVPEPATLSVFSLGLLALWLRRRGL